MTKELLRFWQIQWYSRKCTGGDSWVYFSDFEELLGYFERLYADQDWDLSISVYEYVIDFEPDEVVRFIDAKSRNETEGKDITRTIESILKIRSLVKKTNAIVWWERELVPRLEDADYSLSGIDLQHALPLNCPVLLLGVIDDVEFEDSDIYWIGITPKCRTSEWIMAMGFQMSLTLEKDVSDSLLRDNMHSNSNDTRNSVVAAIVTVEKIEEFTEERVEEFPYGTEWDTETRIVASGELIDCLPLERGSFPRYEDMVEGRLNLPGK